MLTSKPIETFEQDLFNRKPFAERLIRRVLDENNIAGLVGIYARWGSGKTSILNLCKEASEVLQKEDGTKTALWVDPFQTWKLERVGDLQVPLLWHIRNSLPKEIKNDESILYRVGRIAVALSVVGFNVAGKFLGTSNLGSDIVKGFETAGQVLPLGDNVTTNDAFQLCEAITQVAKAIDELGKAICDKNKCDMIVVPIDDMDRCQPERAISLLFSLKNLMVSDRFCFLVALDRHAMARFLSINYRRAFDVEDANWFLEKIFDDWVDLPTPPLDDMLQLIGLPEDVDRPKFVELIHDMGFLAIAKNPRKFIRACQRLERFASHFSYDSEKVKYLAVSFGWCIIYSSNSEQIDSLLSSKGYGGDQFEFVLSLCCLIRLKAPIPKDTSQLEKTKDELKKAGRVATVSALKLLNSFTSSSLEMKIPSFKEESVDEIRSKLPKELAAYSEDQSSALMSFIGSVLHQYGTKMNPGLVPKLMSDCLRDVLPYL